MLRSYGGVAKLIRLLYGGERCESTHRALLALRILTDKEADRIEIMRANGIRPLVELLSSEVDEVPDPICRALLIAS